MGSRLARRPFVWLLGAILFVLAFLHVSGRLESQREPDTAAYTDFDWSSGQAILANTRTIGYPAFLKCLTELGVDESLVPLLQALAQALAAVLFFSGLCLAGLRPWIALCTTLPFLISRNMFEFVSRVLPDAISISAVIAGAACLLIFAALRPSVVASSRRDLGLAMARPRTGTAAGSFVVRTAPILRWLALGGLTGFTFLAYQLRPAYLFVIGLWPIWVLLIDWILGREVARAAEKYDATVIAAGCLPRTRRGNFAVVCAACLLPFVAFCTLRWQLVGHWGLVSFGGFNVTGITTQFLDDELAEELPDSLRPVAREVLRRRALSAFRPPADFWTMEAQFNTMVWSVSHPAAVALHGEDPVAVNRELTRLAHETIRRRPRDYARWLVGNAKHALKQIQFLCLLDPGGESLFAILLLTHLAMLCIGPRPRIRNGEDPHSATRMTTPDAVIRYRERHLLFWTALTFAAAKSTLVILVEPAIDRYMTGAITFLPSALAVYVAAYVEHSGVRLLVRWRPGNSTPH